MSSCGTEFALVRHLESAITKADFATFRKDFSIDLAGPHRQPADLYSPDQWIDEGTLPVIHFKHRRESACSLLPSRKSSLHASNLSNPTSSTSGTILKAPLLGTSLSMTFCRWMSPKRSTTHSRKCRRLPRPRVVSGKEENPHRPVSASGHPFGCDLRDAGSGRCR
jgi:hypothetical protein